MTTHDSIMCLRGKPALPIHPMNDTNASPSPAWAVAGINRPNGSPCTGASDCRCIIPPSSSANHNVAGTSTQSSDSACSDACGTTSHCSSAEGGSSCTGDGQSGYYYGGGVSGGNCRCFAADRSKMSGECSPYDSLTPQQKRSLLLAYYNLPEFKSATAARQPCIQAQVDALNQAALSQNLEFGAIVLFGALIAAYVMYKLVI